MIMELGKSLPEKVRTGLNEARESFSNIQSNIISSFERIREQSMTGEELKNRLASFQKKAIFNFEKTFSDGLQKAYGALNIPTKMEVEEISKRVNKINNEIRRLVDSRTASKAPVKVKRASMRLHASGTRRSKTRKTSR